MNIPNLYKGYCRKCDELDLLPISKRQFTAIFWTIEDLRNTEIFTLETMHVMCEESLSPVGFEKWESVRDILKNTRKDLKKK